MKNNGNCIASVRNVFFFFSFSFFFFFSFFIGNVLWAGNKNKKWKSMEKRMSLLCEVEETLEDVKSAMCIHSEIKHLSRIYDREKIKWWKFIMRGKQSGKPILIAFLSLLFSWNYLLSKVWMKLLKEFLMGIEILWKSYSFDKKKNFKVLKLIFVFSKFPNCY